METTLLIILGIFIYFIIGRVITNLFIEYDYHFLQIENDDEILKFIITLFFPVVLLWYGILKVSDYIFNFLQ